MSRSARLDDLCLQLRALGLPEPVREVVFHPPRRWRFDACWPARKLALEVEGGVWRGGRHIRPSGYLGDVEKYNQASVDGYRLLRVTPEQIADGSALTWVRIALAATEGKVRP